MERPWMKLHTRDWLDNKELRRCSPAARAVLADLMCLAHEGVPYGYLADKVGPLTVDYLASRCVMKPTAFLKAVSELTGHERIRRSDGVLFIPRMVADENVRVRRAAGGSASIGHPKTHPPNAKEGYPPLTKEGDPHLEIDPRARMRADSDSVSDSVAESLVEEREVVSFVAPIRKPQKPDCGGRWEEFKQRWITGTGSSVHVQDAARAWLSVVTPEIEAKVFVCLESYLGSKQVHEHVLMHPENWIFDQARNQWESKWPAHTSPATQGRKTALDGLMEKRG